MKTLMGIEFIESPLVPSELPVITFDPARKCTWASEAYRAEQNALLLKRFGTQQVAFAFQRSALDLRGPRLVVNPFAAAMIKRRSFPAIEAQK